MVNGCCAKYYAKYEAPGKWLWLSVGRVVASNTRGPQFESNDCQIFYLTTVNCTEKTIIKKNRPGMSLFEKTLEGPTESSLM